MLYDISTLFLLLFFSFFRLLQIVPQLISEFSSFFRLFLFIFLTWFRWRGFWILVRIFGGGFLISVPVRPALLVARCRAPLSVPPPPPLLLAVWGALSLSRLALRLRALTLTRILGAVAACVAVLRLGAVRVTFLRLLSLLRLELLKLPGSLLGNSSASQFLF